MDTNLLTQVKKHIDFVTELSEKPKVMLVANIIGNFDWIYDYENYPSDDQGYTELEIELFANSIRNLGFPVEIFFSEKEFFQYIVNNKNPDTLKESILYNMAEGGKGPGQKALVPAFAKFYGLKICNSSPHANSICHHKYHVNQLLLANGLPTPESWVYENQKFLTNSPVIGERVIVKPIYESMCLGVDKDSCFYWNDSKVAYLDEKSIQLNQPILVQKYIEGYEICCPIMKAGKAGKTVSLGTIGFGIDGKEYLSDDYKVYEGHNSHDYFSYVPNISSSLDDKIRLLSQRTFDLLGMSGVGRIDFRVTSNNDLFIFDTNESPPPKEGTALFNVLRNLGLTNEETLQAFFCISASKLL
jgi:D-alanine-D-alanine ligase